MGSINQLLHGTKYIFLGLNIEVFHIMKVFISFVVMLGVITQAKCSRTYGVSFHSHPSGTYGVKYSQPKTHTVLQRPSSGNIKPESNIHDVSEPLYEPTYEKYEPTYELVYQTVQRNIQ